MIVQKVTCASCGASIQIPDDIDHLSCAYCGTSLIVQRGEGFVALKVAEQINRAIQQTGEQTQSVIREGTQVTQSELKRLQLTQEISALQVQLSTIQAEIRTLERQKKTSQIKRQLKELRNQESNLISHIHSRQMALVPESERGKVQQQPIQQTSSGSSKLQRGCLTGCLVYIGVAFALVIIAMPLDLIIFDVPMSGFSDLETSGPLVTGASVISIIAGVIAFAHVMNPDNSIWSRIKTKFEESSNIGKVLIVIGLLMLCFLCGITINSRPSSVTTPPSSNTVHPMDTPRATNTPRPTNTPKPTILQDSATRNGMYTTPPVMAIDQAKMYIATIETEKGNIVVELYADKAPITVNNFVFLARQGFYDNTTFHRVIADFMAQAGDPTGTGMGGPGYQFADEFDAALTFDGPGVLAMANAGANTNGSQFFITFKATPWLDGKHTIFGKVTEGMEVLHSISLRNPQTATTTPGDVIKTIHIMEK